MAIGPLVTFSRNADVEIVIADSSGHPSFFDFNSAPYLGRAAQLFFPLAFVNVITPSEPKSDFYLWDASSFELAQKLKKVIPHFFFPRRTTDDFGFHRFAHSARNGSKF